MLQHHRSTYTLIIGILHRDHPSYSLIIGLFVDNSPPAARAEIIRKHLICDPHCTNIIG